MEIWNPLETKQLPTIEEATPANEWNFWAEKVMIIKENAFPYLDMQLSWKEEDLYSLVYNKKNQMIKHVNKKSCHCHLVLKAVLTDLYLLHAAALEKVNLLPKNFPTLKELHQEEDDRRRQQKKK
eukprot:541133-Ditylum_brightwellii.AAC.1